jgi:hypothetical protein
MSDETTKNEIMEELQGRDNSDLPIGIARLHEEWAKYGLKPKEQSEKPHVGLEPVVFPEPVGDYTVTSTEARERLGLTESAMDRLLAGGGLDSILVKYPDGIRRMVSEAALARFVEDSGMDPMISESLSSPVKEMATTIEALSQEVAEMRDFHTRQLQQFKDVLLWNSGT